MSLSQRRPLAALALILALVVAAWVDVALAGPSARPDPAETITQVARELGLQTQMPKADEPPKEAPWSDVHWHIPGGVAEWVLIGAVATGLGFALYALRDTLPGFSRRSRVKPDAAIVLPLAESVERMHETGDDADALARRGLLAEAMHMLLLRSLIELRKRLDVTIADSLTSREILQRLSMPALRPAAPGLGPTLPANGRHALADLIQRVEFVHFGRQVAAPEDYGACRAAYETLIGAMRSPLAATA